MKTIKFYTKSQYGQDREFVHPDNEPDRQAIAALTGQKTLTLAIRGSIQDLSGGEIKFEEVLPPKN